VQPFLCVLVRFVPKRTNPYLRANNQKRTNLRHWVQADSTLIDLIFSVQMSLAKSAMVSICLTIDTLTSRMAARRCGSAASTVSFAHGSHRLGLALDSERIVPTRGN